ncbi:DNA-binding anti-repressor SinI [Peribacillus sp. NPDC096540]
MKVDQEWVKLIAEARKLGFKKEEISAFLQKENLNVSIEENNEN